LIWSRKRQALCCPTAFRLLEDKVCQAQLVRLGTFFWTKSILSRFPCRTRDADGHRPLAEQGKHLPILADWTLG